jgi:hypothetical protein
MKTVTHIFPKFMRMQGDVFYSCMHSFFARTDVGAGGATDNLVQSVRLVEPDCRDDRPGLPLTIGSLGLPLYLLYIYIGSNICNNILYGMLSIIETCFFPHARVSNCLLMIIYGQLRLCI